MNILLLDQSELSEVFNCSKSGLSQQISIQAIADDVFIQVNPSEKQN